ncbi:Calcium-activated BK potassium channel alpha subunit family protein [Babesia bovis T2Bo]|uniref:Calcium-activated BK potassium channel alpha subunit family protein n=1 Tax=Babesia bovis T2Bo TaxID=484906 RepID=UPI001C35AD4E|nr:Calcium-activated BK potassium channel alpha subunit family protein [Babesia bovis T2Bo]EDO06445.2 Calcium-activated BK potassium channel alpha subunit family protein [Babesia bovis T2Bo]
MAKLHLHDVLRVADGTLSLAVVAYLFHSSTNVCIKVPFAILVAIAILVAASLIAFSLTNVERWIKLVNLGFSRSYVTYNSAANAKMGEEIDIATSQYTNFSSSLNRSVDGSQGMLSRGGSFDSPLRRSGLSMDHMSNISHHMLPMLPDGDPRYASFYKDYNRAPNYARASDELTVLKRVGERLAFYTYLDLEVQKKCKSKLLRLLYGFNFWFKHMWIKPLLHNSVWVISNIIVTVSWCIVWEWAANYMTREEGNYNLLKWSVEKVPEVYWILEGAFQLVFCLNYLINLYEPDLRLKYIFSLRGFIDLSMTPALTQTIVYISSYTNLDAGEYGSISQFGLLFFGPLRFLKLTQAEDLLNKSFDNLSDVHMIIIGIATAAMSLLFSFSGMMYLLESPRSDADFHTPFDFIYFGVATMGTVGYGDFTPRTFMGRLMSILLICTCISLGAVRFKRLKEAITLSDVDMGNRLDVGGYKYVLFWGPMSPYQLLTFCRSIVNSFEGILDAVVVATPLPLETYRVVYSTVKRNTRLNICILGGSEKICAPSSIYKLIGLSTLTVVVNDMETDTHTDNIADDRMTILRTVACLNITKRLGASIDIQLHGVEYAPLVESSALLRTCYLRELKYKLISRSITCRGFFYLILALFHTPSNIRRTRAYVEDLYNLFAYSNTNNSEDGQCITEYSLSEVTEQLFEIATGMQFQIYRLVLPTCFNGMTFVEISQYLYKAKNMFLIGLISKDHCILNPLDYTVGKEGSETYEALVLAKSLRDVLHVSLLQSPNLDILKSSMSGFDSSIPLEITHAIQEHTEVNGSTQMQSRATDFHGIYKVDGYADATTVFAESRSQLILVCGWVVDMDRFLKCLLVDNNANVICLSPSDVVESTCSVSLSSFKHDVVYIDGSGLDADTLLYSGVLEATCVVILNSEQSYGKYNKIELPKDSQVLLVRHLVNHLYSMYKKHPRPVHIIMDIQHSSCLEYLDPSLVSSMDATCKRYAMNRLWQNFGEFMTSYEMASGSIFVQDMLYGLLAHSYVPSPNSVGYEIIQKLLDGNRQLNVYNRVCLVDIPHKFCGATFRSLYMHYLLMEHKISIGILRAYQDPLNKECKLLILVAPQPSFVLHQDDQVYLVEPNKVQQREGVVR